MKEREDEEGKEMKIKQMQSRRKLKIGERKLKRRI